MNEFYGNLTMGVVGDNEYINGNQTKVSSKVRWIVRDESKINQNVREIEEGDFLEVYDGMSRTVFSKNIIKDFDSFYNVALKKQIYKGTTVEWIPYGVDAGFWFNMFAGRYRARLVKHEQTDEEV